MSWRDVVLIGAGWVGACMVAGWMLTTTVTMLD